jgi:hypothetical protein
MSEKYLRQEVSYNSNRPLESIFRNNISRILDFLILNPQFDYSASEMSKITLAEVLRRYVQTAINVNINNARRQHISVQINEKPMP